MLERVAQEFHKGFSERGEVGAAFAVVRDGELVLDEWGGIADPATGKPWQRDTMQLTFSSAKGLTSACVLLLIQRGQLDLDAPVARYWPEFARHGKERITLAQVMSHQARLPGIPRPVTPEEFIDPRRMAAVVADLPQVTDPRAGFVYHGITFGWLAGEIVRRVENRDLGTFFAAEFARPLELDLWLGVPLEHHHRVATVHYEPGWPDAPPPEDDKLIQSFVIPRVSLREKQEFLNSAAFRSCLSPANNAIGTARSLALFYGRLGEVLRPETIELGRTPLHRGPNTLDGSPMAHGVGFQLSTGDDHPPDWFGHDGVGGSSHGAWAERGIAYSYTPNCLSRTKTAQPMLDALSAALQT
jgi:CubicO group peptidase (beta-lactamase class C family)